ncbi:unnamed protein product, partial [Choristocarpus tenellus]
MDPPRGENREVTGSLDVKDNLGTLDQGKVKEAVTVDSTSSCGGSVAIAVPKGGRGRAKGRRFNTRGKRRLRGRIKSSGGKESGGEEVSNRKGGDSGKATVGLGRGKTPRGRRKRPDDSSQDEDEPVAEVHGDPDLAYLWNKHAADAFKDLGHTDEKLLNTIQKTTLSQWDIPEKLARELLDQHQGSWLHPLMEPDEFVEALKGLIPDSKARAPVVSLGRPYRQLWDEEDMRWHMEHNIAEEDGRGWGQSEYSTSERPRRSFTSTTAPSHVGGVTPTRCRNKFKEHV